MAGVEQNEVAAEVTVLSHEEALPGTLVIPPGATGLVAFAHGSGSSRFSVRNRRVAASLNRSGLATLLFDLLTETEADEDEYTRTFRFDIPLLASRLVGATHWLKQEPRTRRLRIGYFGSSTGAAAALIAAADFGAEVRAVVSRGGRPDLAAEALERVVTPTLLIVGGLDDVVIDLNRRAFASIAGEKELEIVPGATHLFEEPGTLDRVIDLAAHWFLRFL